jgi:hypothetical protein
MIMAVRPPRWPKLAQDYEWPWRRLVIPVARWLGLSGLSALRSHQPPAIKANVVARSRGPPGAGSAYTARAVARWLRLDRALPALGPDLPALSL